MIEQIASAGKFLIGKDKETNEHFLFGSHPGEWIRIDLKDLDDLVVIADVAKWIVEE